jgi:hypothetical protein
VCISQFILEDGILDPTDNVDFFLLKNVKIFIFINNQYNISTCRSIMETICDPCSEKNKRLVAEKYCLDCEKKLCMKQSLKVKQTHKIYDYPRDKLYSIQHRVDYRNNQSGRLCVFHSLF